MSRQRRAGVTLMELLVAIVVTGVVASAGYSAFGTLIDQRSAVREAMVDTERAVALREMLRDWLTRGVVSIGASGFPEGGPPEVVAGRGTFAQDGITVFTREPTSAPGWATAIRFFIDTDPRTPERGLTMRYMSISSSPDLGNLNRARDLVNNPDAERNRSTDPRVQQLSPQPVTRELDSLIIGLQVEYLDESTRRWFPARELTTIQARAARVTLQGHWDAPIPPLLRLPIVVVIPPQVIS